MPGATDDFSLEDNDSKNPTSEEDKFKKKEELIKKLEVSEKKLLEKLKEKHAEELQKAVNEAVGEVAGKNSELRNKIITLEEELKKQKELNINLNAALKEEREKQKEERSLSQDELLDALYKTSINERQKKILAKYGDALKEFEKSLGENKFTEALNTYLVNLIEEKLMAVKKSPNEV